MILYICKKERDRLNGLQKKVLTSRPLSAIIKSSKGRDLPRERGIPMTKREMYSNIRTLLADNAEVVAFCDHEIELLSRPKVKKPTKNQVENEGYLSDILDTLAGSAQPMTITDIVGHFDGLSNQRVSALVKKLKDAGKVVRTEVKGKAYFTLSE